MLKDLQNSNVWKEQLMACQRQILAEGGSLGGDLKSCLRDLQYVQPRFESFVTPRRRYVCLLRAVALVLAVKAGDARLDSGVRNRAQEALKKMGDPKDVRTMARCACSSCGPSTSTTTPRRLAARSTTSRRGCACSPDTDASTLGGPRERTLTQIAVEAVREPLTVK